jgi:hypothetical protein
VVKAYVDKQRRQPVKIVNGTKPKSVEMGAVWDTPNGAGQEHIMGSGRFVVDLPKKRLPLAAAAPGLGPAR